MTKQQQQLIIGVLVAFLGIFVYWKYFVIPTMADIKTKQALYQDLVGKVETAKRQAQRLPALQAELEKLRIDLLAMEKQLPTDKDIPSIIRILTKEAQVENIEFTSMAPKPLTNQSFFQIIPFDLQFTGTLHGLARFLAALGQQDRIFQAQNLKLNQTGGTAETGIINLNISLLIQTYAYSGAR